MSTLQTSESIRDLINVTFERLGANSQQSMEETILIRDGHFCGRRYSRKELCAIWFVEENEIKFYDFNGGVVEVISAGIQEERLSKRAA